MVASLGQRYGSRQRGTVAYHRTWLRSSGLISGFRRHGAAGPGLISKGWLIVCFATNFPLNYDGDEYNEERDGDANNHDINL